MGQILAVAASSTGTVTQNDERAQFLVVEITSSATLTSLTVTGEKSGVIINLDANGVIILGQARRKTAFTTTYLLPLGVGRSTETTTYSVVTGSGGNGVNLYTSSFEHKECPPICYTQVQQTANTTNSYSKFFYMGFVPGSGDTYIVQGNRGLMSMMTALEIRQISGQDTNLVNTNVLIDNTDQSKGQITVNTAANPCVIYRSYLGVAV